MRDSPGMAERDDYSLATAERIAIVRALSKTEWNKFATAQLLGISRSTLYRKIAEHAIGGAKDGEPR